MKLFTVADLISKLQTFPQDAIAMTDCEDEYYSGPIDSDKIEIGSAALIGPYEVTIQGQIIKCKGGWIRDDDCGEFVGPVFARQKAVFIK